MFSNLCLGNIFGAQNTDAVPCTPPAGEIIIAFLGLISHEIRGKLMKFNQINENS